MPRWCHCDESLQGTKGGFLCGMGPVGQMLTKTRVVAHAARIIKVWMINVRGLGDWMRAKRFWYLITSATHRKHANNLPVQRDFHLECDEIHSLLQIQHVVHLHILISFREIA